MNKTGILIYGHVSAYSAEEVAKLPSFVFDKEGKLNNQIAVDDNGTVYYDSKPELVGTKVLLTDFDEPSQVYTANLDGYEFTCGANCLEDIKDIPSSGFSVKANLSKNKRKQSRVSKVVSDRRQRKTAQSRTVQISSCTKCDGKPTLVPFELPTCTGNRCSECYLVNDYTNK